MRRKILEVEPQREPLEDAELLRELARALVTKPERVRVRAETKAEPPALLLHLTVDQTDRHRVIGRSGRIISAVRNIFTAVGRIDGRSVQVQLEEA